MKFILILLLAFSVNHITATNDEDSMQWASICKDFENDTIAGAGYDNGFCTNKELSKKYISTNRLINTKDLSKIKNNYNIFDDSDKNQNHQLIIDLIKAHKKKILAFLGASAAVALVYKLIVSKS